MIDAIPFKPHLVASPGDGSFAASDPLDGMSTIKLTRDDRGTYRYVPLSLVSDDLVLRHDARIAANRATAVTDLEAPVGDEMEPASAALPLDAAKRRGSADLTGLLGASPVMAMVRP